MTFEQPPGQGPGPEELRGAELDEFLGRAVERQIAEQRALRETLTALTQAVNALSAPGTRIDPDDMADRVRAAVRASIDPLVGDIRSLGDDLSQKVKAIAAPAAARSGSASDEELAQLRESVSTVSADIEGIAQALIDLNAGLRDWASGVDRSIASIRDTVERVRELAAENRHTGVLDDPGGQADVGEPVVQSDLEQRIRESTELSLYLADQIEEFERVLSGFGELPSKLEGVVAQGMRRTLAARAKLDTEANTTLEQTLALLDSYVDKMSGTVERFAQSEETLRKLGLGQVELGSRLDSLYEAVHELAQGRDSRAATLTKPRPQRKPKAQTGKPQRAKAEKKSTRSGAKKTTRRRTRKTASDEASTD